MSSRVLLAAVLFLGSAPGRAVLAVDLPAAARKAMGSKGPSVLSEKPDPGGVDLSSLYGEWKLSEIIYRGQSIGLPNPDLDLRWTFFSNRTSRLYWDRGTPEFCERFARYSLEPQHLVEKVFSVNPDNAAECQKDPDMQVDRTTRTQIEILDGKVRFHFQMGDENLVYVLLRTGAPAPP